MFFHFLSFSLSLLGAQKSDFFWASISLRFLLTVLVKNQFWGPSRVVYGRYPFGPSFPFFPTLFSPVFRLFSYFLFHCLSFFCSFLHFLISECFSFSFFIFSEEKVSSFLFYLYFFQIFFIAGICIRV